MPNLDLVLQGVVDPVARENFERLVAFSSEQVLGKFEGRFLTITVTAAVTAMRYPHGLTFVPQDIIVSSYNGSGAVTWLWSLFDRDDIVLTTTGAATIRVFVGSYRES